MKPSHSNLEIKTLFLISFSIKALPPLGNAQTRKHFRERMKDVEVWAILVKAAIGKSIPKSPSPYCLLTLKRFSTKMPDYDGLVMSFKHVVDGIKNAGVLVDDNYAVTGQWDVTWAKVSHRKQEGIEVQVLGYDKTVADSYDTSK